MNFCCLGTGSAGNAIAAWGEDWGVLIDAGLSCKQIRLRCAERGVPLAQIHTLLVTHSHGDHIQSIKTLVEREGFDRVYATAATIESVDYLAAHPLLCEVVEPGKVFFMPKLPHVKFIAVETHHNAAGAVTYFVKERASKLAMFVETGRVTPQMLKLGAGAQGYVIEANHDPYMCADNEKRPRHINERTYHTHLSNDQAAEVVCGMGPEARVAVFVHVSRENNDPELLRRVLRKAYDKRGLPLAMRVSEQDKPTEVFLI